MGLLQFSFGFFDLTLLLITILILLLWLRSRRPSGLPPGPMPLPIIGNFHNLDREHFMERIRGMREQFGDIFSLSMGQFWVIFVHGSENLRELLVKKGDFTTDRPPIFSFKLNGTNGIISTSGTIWKHQRTFALSKLRDFGFGKRSFESSIMEEAEIFMDLIASFKGKPFDIADIIHTSMSNVVMSISVGRRFDYDDPQFKTFVSLLNANISDKAFQGPAQFAPFLVNLPGDIFGVKKIQSRAHQVFDFFRKEIKEHEQTLDTNNVRDFIDIYLKEIKNKQNIENEKDIFTASQLLHIITDLFAAGTETTATVIKWAIVYFLHNPEIQRKMSKEIDECVGTGRLPKLADKPNLPYCNAVMLEALRIGNVVPYSLPHYVTEDIQYKGYTIPKNSIIFPCLDSVANDEDLFPDSQKFKPERFLDADGKLSGEDKNLSFSLGRRVCLGESLARMELFLYLTSLVQRFEFLPPEGKNPPAIEVVLGVTRSPAPYTFRAVQRS